MFAGDQGDIDPRLQHGGTRGLWPLCSWNSGRAACRIVWHSMCTNMPLHEFPECAEKSFKYKTDKQKPFPFLFAHLETPFACFIIIAHTFIKCEYVPSCTPHAHFLCLAFPHTRGIVHTWNWEPDQQLLKERDKILFSEIN